MSQNLKPATTNTKSPTVHMTSFNGGAERGRCMQLDQNGDVVHADEKQVKHMVKTMQAWLDRSL